MANELIEPIRFTRKFIELHGASVLEKLGEAPLPQSHWHMSTYGGVIRVEGEHDELFERLAIVLPNPQDVAPERFHEWAEQRIEHLHWYMEQGNTGRKMFHNLASRCVVAVFVRRIGRAIQDPLFELPEPQAIPGVLERFVLDVDRYVQAIGDSDLRYVRAVKVFTVPRKKIDNEHIISLDVLPTLIGLEGEPAPINPLTLVRGVLGEFAELVEANAHRVRLNAARRSSRKKRRRIDELMALVAHLDQICQFIDVQRPALVDVRKALSALKPVKRKPQSKKSRLVTIGLVLGCCLLAWYLAR